MPAVNLPPHETESNVTFASLQTPHQRLILNLNVALTVLLVLGVLHFATRSKRRNRTSSRRASLAELAGNCQQYQQQQPGLRITKKSRGVSNNFNTAMSTKKDSKVTQLKADDGSEKNDDKHVIEAYGESRENIEGNHRHGSLRHNPEAHARPPPPPPLTPPTLAPGGISFEERRLSSAVSTIGDLDTSFFHQPNPDYSSSSSSSTSTSVHQQAHVSPTTPRRRSYTKMLPLSPPEPVGILEDDGEVRPFAPSSFPSSSPILPLAPHDSFHSREIDVKGEIISVMDGAGAGWKRHTRVYGGGVCLACLAAGGEGGFYGARVRPEERR